MLWRQKINKKVLVVIEKKKNMMVVWARKLEEGMETEDSKI